MILLDTVTLVEKGPKIQFFNDSAREQEEMLNCNYDLRSGYPPSGHHRGNHRTATHLKGIAAQRVADIYNSMGIVKAVDTKP